jgi:hypothetical protein
MCTLHCALSEKALEVLFNDDPTVYVSAEFKQLRQQRERFITVTAVEGMLAYVDSQLEIHRTRGPLLPKRLLHNLRFQLQHTRCSCVF